jgi:hypothetical protein
VNILKSTIVNIPSMMAGAVVVGLLIYWVLLFISISHTYDFQSKRERIGEECTQCTSIPFQQLGLVYYSS